MVRRKMVIIGQGGRSVNLGVSSVLLVSRTMDVEFLIKTNWWFMKFGRSGSLSQSMKIGRCRTWMELNRVLEEKRRPMKWPLE